MPGVRLNLGKKSASLSFGGKGARYTVSSTGRKTATVGIPGTGLYYSETVSATQRRKDDKNMPAEQGKPRRNKPFYQKWWVWVLVVVLIVVGATSGNDAAEPDASADASADAAQIEESQQDDASSGQVSASPSMEAPDSESAKLDEQPAKTPEQSTEPEMQEKPVEAEAPKQETQQGQISPATAEPEPKPEPEPEPEPEPPAATKPQPSGGSQSPSNYVASMESDKYHKLSCRFSKKILEENRIYFPTKDAAASAGYVPCGTCKP